MSLINFLRRIISRLKETLGFIGKIANTNIGTDNIPSEENISLEYLDFLKYILQVTSDSVSDPEIVYSILKANQDKLDDNFTQLWQTSLVAVLSQIEPEQASSVASLIGDFSCLIQDFTLGDRAINREVAIKGFEAIDTIYTRSNFRNQWAITQNNLATAYLYRIRGERMQNLEEAILKFQAALQIFTQEEFPEQWALVQHNLGIAYSERLL